MISTPMLDQYTTDLTLEVRKNPDRYHAFAREKEIAQVIYNLSRRTKNNPILIGEAGTGKTAIVEGLAREMVLKRAGRTLNRKHIRVLQVASLGHKDVISKFLRLIKEAAATKDTNILFIDEVHTIMGVDQGNGAMDLGDVLKPAMARGDIQLIGATTLDEYDKFIERDPALERRFQQVIVNEPNRDTAVTIVQGVIPKFEETHHVTYTQDAIEGSVDLSIRYIADRYLPDKAFDLIDQAGAISKLHGKKVITIREIALALQDMKGIPISNILKNEDDTLFSLRNILKKDIKGQDEAIDEVVNAVTIAKAGLQAPNKPLSSFLFLGTTGTGKTALTKALTKALFDDVSNMVRFDMSEFSEANSLDHFQDLLTTNIKKKPYCILLFDEVEKAYVGVHDRLLQILDDGELRDRRGRSTNFRNCIIIMTTNLGAELISDKQDYDSRSKNDSSITKNILVRKQDSFRKQVQFELTNVFRPEFVNRIDHKVVFNMLTRDIIEEIATHNLEIINERLKEQDFYLTYDQKVVGFLADIGTDEKNGARPLARCIETEVTGPISMAMLKISRSKNSKIKGFKLVLEGKPLPSELQRHLKGSRKIKIIGLTKEA